MSSPNPPLKAPIIYVKMPKCAGSSLQNLLVEKDRLYEIQDPSFVELETLIRESKQRVIQVRHANLACIEKRFPEWTHSAWIFAIVRNPRSRFVSGWRYCETTRWRSFSSVVKSPPRREDNEQDWHHMTKPLLDFALNEKQEFLIDHVVKFENLQEDLKPVFEKIGFPEMTLPHVNKTKHADFRLYYSKKNWNRVGEIFAKDLALFGYEEEAPKQTPAAYSERVRVHIEILWNWFLRKTTRQS